MAQHMFPLPSTTITNKKFHYNITDQVEFSGSNNHSNWITVSPYRWGGAYSAYYHWTNIGIRGTIECITGGTFRIGLPNKTASPDIILCEYTLTSGNTQSISKYINLSSGEFYFSDPSFNGDKFPDYYTDSSNNFPCIIFEAVGSAKAKFDIDFVLGMDAELVPQIVNI